MDDRLLFYLLAETITLIIGIRAAIIYFKWRTKHNLATLIIISVVFIGGILSYLFPGKLIPGAGLAVQITFGVIIFIMMLLLLFYPELKQLLRRWRTKD